MSTRRPSVFVLAALSTAAVVTACGSDGSTSTVEVSPTVAPNGDEAVDLDEIRAELDQLEFESPTVDGVSVLGNEPIGGSTGDVADTPATEASVDAELAEDCAEGDECPELDEIYGGNTVAEPEVAPEVPLFVPTAEWAPFCTVLAELEDRPFPTDDDEALRTVDVWFRLLEPHVPELIDEPFGQLDDALDRAVDAGDPSILDDIGDDLAQAADRVGRAVDAGCSGRGSIDDLD